MILRARTLPPNDDSGRLDEFREALDLEVGSVSKVVRSYPNSVVSVEIIRSNVLSLMELLVNVKVDGLQRARKRNGRLATDGESATVISRTERYASLRFQHDFRPERPFARTGPG